MTAPTLGQARKARSASKKPVWTKDGFTAVLSTFLQNKALSEHLTFVNQGDKETPGLRDSLLEQVKRHGEKDPESGSFILALDEAVPYGTQSITKVKAEARGAKVKTLNIERAEDLLTLLSEEDEEGVDYVDAVTVEAISITDNLTHFQAAKVAALLDKLGVDYNSTMLFDEDKILALHMVDEVLTAKQIDGLYDAGDITWALKPLP